MSTLSPHCVCPTGEGGACLDESGSSWVNHTPTMASGLKLLWRRAQESIGRFFCLCHLGAVGKRLIPTLHASEEVNVENPSMSVL